MPLKTNGHENQPQAAVSIVDSHCHLDFPDFDGKLDETIAKARAAGVMRMVTICTRLANEPKVRAIAEAYSDVFYAAGTHPNSVAEEPLVNTQDLVSLAKHPKFVGIGETGLDYHYTADSAAIQQKSLRIHIEAAQETGLPLIIHSRNADDDMRRILSEGYKQTPYHCVLHCFSSGEALAKCAVEMGFYLSMSGIITFPKSQELRDIFANIPLNRVLLETDSPYLAPVPCRGKRNEPAFTAHTAQAGASIYGLELHEFAAQTTQNFNCLFTKVEQGNM